MCEYTSKKKITVRFDELGQLQGYLCLIDGILILTLNQDIDSLIQSKIKEQCYSLIEDNCYFYVFV